MMDANHAHGSREIHHLDDRWTPFYRAFEPANAGNATAPEIQEGLLDLSDWSFDEDGPVVLGGPWEFWWGELLTQESREPNGLIQFLAIGMDGSLKAQEVRHPDKGVPPLDFESNCLGRWTMSLEFISVSQSAPHLFMFKMPIRMN